MSLRGGCVGHVVTGFVDRGDVVTANLNLATSELIMGYQCFDDDDDSKNSREFGPVGVLLETRGNQLSRPFGCGCAALDGPGGSANSVCIGSVCNPDRRSIEQGT